MLTTLLHFGGYLLCLVAGGAAGYAFRGKISAEKNALGKDIGASIANQAKKL
jgi:hypothetical protein